MGVKEEMNAKMAVQNICINCKHFSNSPAYLESVFKGMTTFSSGHASIRKDDGICQVNDVYLSADHWCDKFTSR